MTNKRMSLKIVLVTLHNEKIVGRVPEHFAFIPGALDKAIKARANKLWGEGTWLVKCDDSLFGGYIINKTTRDGLVIR